MGGCTSLVKLQVQAKVQAQGRGAGLGSWHGWGGLCAAEGAGAVAVCEGRTVQPRPQPSPCAPQASFNRLRGLPAELGRLPRLEMLRVASCEIEEVPAALRDAPRLAWMRWGASGMGGRVVRPGEEQLLMPM